ncbi:non-ribosomal peptide synthetase [Enterocloster clostridioformis]
MEIKSLHESISIQCKRYADKIAVIDYERKITYWELEEMSSLIADRLLNDGIAPGMTVVVIADRCLELIIVALGVMKCGAIYVPVDMSYPTQRILNIIDDTKCNIIINISDHHLETYNGTILTLEQLSLSKRDSDSMNQSTFNGHIAYIIYTSGTTGKPKGVMVSNNAIMNTFEWMTDQFDINENDVIAHKTSISFTDSIWEIFWPLLNGAKISIINSKHARDPKRMYEWMEQQRISFTQFVPSMLKVFVEYIEFKRIENPLSELRWVFNGGEQVGVNLVRRFYDCFKTAKYANIYGMTESAIYATCHVVERESLRIWNSIPIGKPILNSSILLLNEYNQICSPFEKGEICITGVSLADGYWNDAELTKDKFTCLNTSNDRLYRSGDIGMSDDYGNYWFLGRKDNQVNVYGNRVELYEIEKNILEYDGISLTAVIPCKNWYGETYLVCYLENDKVDVENLKVFLRDRLPNYMIPKEFHKINALPLTVNNKVDRKNLCELFKNEVSDDKAALEKVSIKSVVHNIWNTILGIDEISHDDDFFQLGGDSLTLARLQIELEKQGFSLSYDELLEHKTINQIVVLLERMTQ